MKKSVYSYLSFFLFIYLTVSLNGQVIKSNEIEKGTNIQRNASFNVEEIKVRWKKAALENCPGVPCVAAPSFTCGTSTISDIDNNSYPTVLIGAQCWTNTNLKVTKYNDGTLIGDSTTSTWGTPGAALNGARTGYDVSVLPLNDYVGAFGYLYNWYAITDSRKLCPDGWHVPTDAEWTIMIKTLDPNQAVNSGNVLTFTGVQSTIAGTVMKSKTTNPSVGSGLGWNPGSPGTNLSGFSGLPGGYRSYPGIFHNIINTATFWSATEVVGSSFGFNRFLFNNNSNVSRGVNDKSVGYSVRCLKD
jgi:uncharacterized protein (TIGR02145 family)